MKNGAIDISQRLTVHGPHHRTKESRYLPENSSKQRLKNTKRQPRFSRTSDSGSPGKPGQNFWHQNWQKAHCRPGDVESSQRNGSHALQCLNLFTGITVRSEHELYWNSFLEMQSGMWSIIFDILKSLFEYIRNFSTNQAFIVCDFIKSTCNGYSTTILG